MRRTLCLVAVSRICLAQSASWLDAGMPHASTTDELESAFGGNTAPPSSKPPSLLDGVPPPRSDPALTEAPPPPEEMQLAREMTKAELALQENDVDEAHATVKRWPDQTRKVSPQLAQKALELGWRVASRASDDALSKRMAERWLLSCGPDKVKACRTRALSAMDSNPAASAALRKEVSNIRVADECVERAETEGRSSCLGSAQRTYRATGDHLMLARIAVAEARAAQGASDNRRVHLWSEASHACSEPRCADLMKTPWHELNAIFSAEGNIVEAAKAAIREVQQLGLAATVDARPYVRTVELDRACEALDAQSGPGACRKLEKQLTGRYSFHDFSKRTLPGTGLPPDEIKKVADHFSIALQECLAAEAARLERGNPEQIRLSWTVLNDGRADSIRVEDHPRDAGPLGACVRRQVALWRYPKYRGEWQHVEQEFRIEHR